MAAWLQRSDAMAGHDNRQITERVAVAAFVHEHLIVKQRIAIEVLLIVHFVEELREMLDLTAVDLGNATI